MVDGFLTIFGELGRVAGDVARITRKKRSNGDFAAGKVTRLFGIVDISVSNANVERDYVQAATVFAPDTGGRDVPEGEEDSYIHANVWPFVR